MMINQNPEDITLLGKTLFRHHSQPFGIKRADRRSHLYVIGKTGVGKSTFLANMLRQDILAGEGLCLLDPHGDLIERLLPVAQATRPQDLIYFNVADYAHPLGFNPLSHVPVHKRPLAASGMLEVFKKMWADSWGPRTEHLLRNSLLTLLDIPFTTLADILRLLQDPAYRRQVIPYITNQQVRLFWQQEFEGYTARLRIEAIAPIQNKVGAFLADPILRAILTAPKNSFHLREVMDSGKLLMVNLSKGLIGQDTASLLGALLVSCIGITGLTRADIREPERRDFYVYLDEFQNTSTGSLATMLSELRKYRINLILANQYLSQLEETICDAILGNIGSICAFRVGPQDAELLAKEFAPEFGAMDLMNLANHHCFIRLVIDGAMIRPFSAVTGDIRTAQEVTNYNGLSLVN